MIVVLAFVQLEHRLAGLEVMADEQPRLLELRQHAVDRGEPDVESFGQQQLVDVLGGQVAHLRRLEQVDDLESRNRRLQSGALQVVRCRHGMISVRACVIVAIIAISSMIPTVFRQIHPRVRGAARAASLVARASLAAGGCATPIDYVPSWRSFGVYKIDINQGNYLSQDMVDKLKVGMTQQQVKQLLGTPLVNSPFRPDRWDYVYEYTRQGKVVEHRNFTVHFADAQGHALGRRRDARVGRRAQSIRERQGAAVERAWRKERLGSLPRRVPQVSRATAERAHRDRRRRRPNGPGADRGDARIAGDLTLAGALDVAESPAIGVDAGERCGRATGVRIAADVAPSSRPATY